MNASPYETLLQTYFQDGVEAFLPQVSINCVVFKYEHPQLKVLVHQFPGMEEWYLPGGYVRKEESLEAAADRNLSYSGIERVFLQQIQTFGEVDRIANSAFPTGVGPQWLQDIVAWVSQRFITVVYYGLIREVKGEVQSGGLFQAVDWRDISDLQGMAFDHAKIIRETHALLATELLNRPVAANLLPEAFSLTELRGLFEVILGRPIDRGSFRRKMLRLGILKQVAERKESVGRPAQLFSFDESAYLHLLEKENQFGF